jgi:hypothetical protein
MIKKNPKKKNIEEDYEKEIEEDSVRICKSSEEIHVNIMELLKEV